MQSINRGASYGLQDLSKDGHLEFHLQFTARFGTGI